MGIARGPNIITEDLVFGYDSGYGIASLVNSTRFYKGRPATNTILSGATWFGDGGNQTVGNKGYTIITDENLKYNGYETVLWTPGISRNVYFNGNDDISTSDNSTVWTFSCYMRYEDQTTEVTTSSGGSVYLYYPNSDGSSSGTITDCGNGWYRVSRTRTGTSDNIGLAGFTGFVQNKKIYLSGPMLTKTSTEVPYIERSVTRANTDSLIDLKRTNSIDVSNVSFGSTGQPEFDGTDDYLQLNAKFLPALGAFTMEFLFQISTTGGRGGMFERNPSSPYNGGLIGQGGSGSWYFQVSNGSQSLTIDDMGYPSTNTWYHDVGVYDGVNTIKFYRNGSLHDTVTGSSIGNIDSAGSRDNMRFMKRDNNSGVIGGKVAISKVYNKALSDIEVKQNYNAYKNRFNI